MTRIPAALATICLRSVQGSPQRTAAARAPHGSAAGSRRAAAPLPAGVGAPSKPLEFLRDSPYFKYIYENHQGHHVLGGQCNYNVCCPGTDFLLGTYVPVATWTKKMRAVPGADATERWGVPVEPLGVPQAPIIGVGQATIEDLTPTALIDAPPESSFDGVVVPTQPATVAGGAALA